MSTTTNQMTLQPSGEKTTLMDLDTDVFQLIIVALVEEISVTEAWELRAVCKTFRQLLEHEILANKPIECFAEEDKSISIVQNNLETYLWKRVHKSQTILEVNPLPRYLVKCVDKILSEFPRSNRNGEDLRDEYFQVLIKHVSNSHDPCLCTENFGTNQGLDRTRPSLLSNHSLRDHLMQPDVQQEDFVMGAIAVGCGTMPMILEYVRSIEDHFEYRFMFSRVLVAAVQGGRFNTFTFMLDFFQLELDAAPHWYHRDQGFDRVDREIRHAIRVVIKSEQDPEMLRKLLAFRLKNYLFDSEDLFKIIKDTTEVATNTSCFGLLEVALSFREAEDRSFSCYDWWTKICQHGLQVIRYLLDHRHTAGSNQDERSILRTSLSCAVKSGRADIVSLLIDYGADVNDYSPHKNHQTTPPLKLAVYWGQMDIAKSLIEAGANISHGNPLTALLNCRNRLSGIEMMKNNAINSNVRIAKASTYAFTRLLLDKGTNMSQNVAWAMESEAENLVVCGKRWTKGDFKREAEEIMAIVAIQGHDN